METNVNGAARKVDGEPVPGMVVYADWAGGDNAKMRLLERYEHPAENGWRVNVYDHHAKRYCKTIQSVSEESIRAAIAKAGGVK